MSEKQACQNWSGELHPVSTHGARRSTPRSALSNSASTSSRSAVGADPQREVTRGAYGPGLGGAVVVVDGLGPWVLVVVTGGGAVVVVTGGGGAVVVEVGGCVVVVDGAVVVVVVGVLVVVTALSPMPERLGNCWTSMPVVATFMKSSHIDSGRLLPPTSLTLRPGMLSSGWGTPSTSRYMPTEVTSCGTNPVNQTDLCSSEVPVLPAVGRPRPAARAPVPPEAVTCWRASMVSAATSGPNAAVTCLLTL